MGNRVKKYRMKAIPSAFSEKGGFNAQFIGDGYSVDARTEILPAVIVANGVQVGEGTAWDLVNAFLKACAQRAANTGETVNVGSLLSFGLAIKGWYANKDSKAAKDAVRVTASLLGDLRPTVAFSMSNALDGITLTLATVMSDGCALGHVRQGAAFRINGKGLKMLDDSDTVTATAKTADGQTVTAACAVSGSEEDHVDATLPAAFSLESLAGREIRFTVRCRCGDPEATAQEKSISAVLDAAEPGPGPVVPVPTLTEGHSQAHEAETGKMFPQFAFILSGANLTDASVHLKYVGQSGTPHDEEISADNYEISEDGTELVIGPGGIVNAMESTQVGDTITVEATTAGGTASYDAEHAANE